MFDLTKKCDKNTFQKVKLLHDKATTDNKLFQMHHHFTTQPNKSLNIQAAEVAPKWKHYSQTESLNYRMDMVVGHHNLGLGPYYDEVFNVVGIDVDGKLVNAFAVRDKRNQAKKKRDTSIEHKCTRQHKFEAKLKEELYLEKTKDIKIGTCGSGKARRRSAIIVSSALSKGKA